MPVIVDDAPVYVPPLMVLALIVSPAIVLPVRLATVVDASVDEPETVRLVKAPSVAVIRFVNIELKVAKTEARPCDDEVPETVVELNEPVPPLKVLALMVLPAIVCAVTLVRVVEARVDEPETERLVVVRFEVLKLVEVALVVVPLVAV